MSTRNFEVLYTHQKLKKAKTWQDGCLKVSSRGTKAVLYDDQDCSLEVFHIHSNKIFPGSDVECERYLISIVDEKIADDKGSNCGMASQDISSKRHLAYLPSARTDHSGSTWRKRKQDFRETFRPNLPSPDQDCEPPENLKPRSPLCFKRPSTNDNYGLPKPSTISRFLPAKSDNLHLTSTVPDENDAARMSRLVRTSRGETSFHQQRNETSCFPQRNFQETMSVFAQDIDLENTPGDSEVLASQVNVDEKDLILQKSNQVTMQNHFPAPKRNKSELLSLFGGAKNMVIARDDKPGLRSIEGDDFPPESYSTVTKCKTKSLFYQSFDMSLGDEEDFSDNSFQSLCNLKSESFIPGATSKPTSLPPQSASTGNDSICVKNYNFDLDDGQAVFSRNFDRNSSPRTSDFEKKNRGLQKPEAINPGLCSTGGCKSSPSSAFEEWCVQNNDIIDIQHDDLANDIALSDDFDDAEIPLFDGFSETPQSSLFSSNNMRFQKQCFGSEKFDRSNADDHSDQSSLKENAFEKEINNISVQNHSLSRVSRKYNHFTPPLISLSSGDKKHVSLTSTYQTDLKAPSFDRAVPEPNSRQQSFSGELHFPSNIESSDSVTPTRQMTITTKFSSAMDYKCVMKSALREHLNIVLFELAQKYHGILGKADIASSDDTVSDEKENVKGPSCSHGPGKLRAVKKDGRNKGRHFYTCPASGLNQCKFFQWADENHATSTAGNKKISLTSSDSIRTFFKSKGIYFYHNCILERRSKPTKYYGKKYSRKAAVVNEKKAMYITLKYRDSSSLYTKDDLWIISKNVNFDPKATFVAKSSFYGPSSNGDLEIEPVSGYSTSNWRSGDTVHAIWACNAGTELSCIQNLDEHVSLQQMPLLPYILNGSHPSFNSRRSGPGFFSAPLSGRVDRNSLGIPWPVIEQEVNEIIALYKLNPDQSTAIRSCAKMFVSENDNGGKECLPITLIHGVFGAGKSFLLAVVVLLMVKLFEMADASDEAGSSGPITWKILISSTTNVAVDRILLGLLDLGFDQFVRVGSVRKIAKPVLPFSIHSVGTESQELKELQGTLKTELTSLEKAFVRKSIEMHKLGENRKRLANVRVVGVTCAACTFASLERLKFPVLLLDECSQMTEPTSLLPIARFGCRRLVLVGDPKQLNPTIQGSEPSHESGLEQTLFDRLIKMDMKPILLRTQYRCHPLISSISNRLFYNDQLLDGVNAEERKPLVDFIPTLCFYDVANGKEECSQDGSYFNTSEAKFVVTLIKSLLESEIEPKQIGVISQYKSQLTAINNSLSADGATSQKELAGIQISTVDAFQGGEKDVIILSCVRTKHIGFIDCERRTNVALTRAKRHLCIVGRGKMLSSNALWKKILTICRDSPLGLQSSESYVMEWKERRPKTDGSSSGPKKRRKPRKGGGPGRVKTTPKLSNETLTGQTIDTCKPFTASGKTRTKRPASIELNEIFESNSNVTCGENDCDDIDWGPTITISDNDSVPEAFDDNDDIINTNEDEFLNSDNDVKKIEILSDSRLDMADDNIGECCEGKKDLGREETAGKQVDNLEKNCCSEYVFDDDFLLDSELCNMEY